MQNPVRGLLHGVSALLSVVGAAALWSRTAGDLFQQSALLVFGLSLVGLYSVSSAYHSVRWNSLWQGRMQRIDHAMIYVLIAGSYTPIAAIVLDGWLRFAALGTVWGITAVGVVQKLCWPQLGHGYSVALQVAQGWFGLLLLAPLYERLGGQAVGLLVLGGFFYTLGMVAFTTRRPRLWPRVFSYHEIFHVLVVGGSATHYAMTFLYVARFGAA
ncbi:MAG: hemolysin III family protein [Deltaproteobacteria bacterium]|nr:hemolysin III family protein [Deltaproteobacteria bacterium]